MDFLPLSNSEKSREIGGEKKEENLEIGSGHNIGQALPAFLFYFILA